MTTAITACNNNIPESVKNVTTKIHTRNLTLNINTPTIQNNNIAQIIINRKLKLATRNNNITPNLDSIKKFYQQNPNNSLQITTSWKVYHNNITASTAINSLILKNNEPSNTATTTLTTINNEITEINDIIDTNNNVTKNIIVDKFLCDKDLTANATQEQTNLIKPLSQFPISENFILTEKNLTLIYNPFTLTDDGEMVVLNIPYSQITDVLRIKPETYTNLTTTEFNAPLN